MTDSLLDTAALDTADVYEWEDEDPTFDPDGPWEDDVQADADTLAGIGWGTDEDYGFYGDEEPPF